MYLFANKQSHINPYIVVLRCENHDSETQALEFLKQNTEKMVIKSKTAQAGRIELNTEIRLKSDNTDFINSLASMSGVNSVALVSYNGDYMG